MHRIAISPLLLLAACSGSGQTAAAGSEEDKIACALGGSRTFARDCTIERVQQDGKLTLVVRHPDGGFRRFEVLTDGRGVASLDGADEVETALVGSELEVVVGNDAYRFPATRKPATQGNASTGPAAK